MSSFFGPSNEPDRSPHQARDYSSPSNKPTILASTTKGPDQPIPKTANDAKLATLPDNARLASLNLPRPTWAQRISAELLRRHLFEPGHPTEREISNHAPSGSGFDNGTKLCETSTPGRLVFLTSFHHMNDYGTYIGWTTHSVVVTPCFTGFNLRVTGRNKRGVKEYIADTFHHWLSSPYKV